MLLQCRKRLLEDVEALDKLHAHSRPLVALASKDEANTKRL